ncbi:MAG: glycosyltransferase family 2 protein, partial [Candidatus Shapirobacteria bacterium]|nr:glycosyltransferase family 2 protein [Candidatus Shapirobacteria bacterium]
MKNYSITIWIPTRNVAPTIKETLDSLFAQSYQNFDIHFQDNGSTDSTEKIINQYKNKFPDKKIVFKKNYKDIGALTYSAARPYFSGDITVFLAGDDLLSQDALFEINQVFNKFPDIGAVTRPYFWFTKDCYHPIRAKKILNHYHHTKLSLSSNFDQLSTMISTIDQISGLAFKTKYLPRHQFPSPWTSTVSTFMTIFRDHPVVMLKNYTVAVRISQYNDSRQKNTLKHSPVLSWVQMTNQIFKDIKYRSFKRQLISNFIAINYVGLIQIKNFGTLKGVFKEIYYLIKYRSLNIFSPSFWFYSLLSIFIPGT